MHGRARSVEIGSCTVVHNVVSEGASALGTHLANAPLVTRQFSIDQAITAADATLCGRLIADTEVSVTAELPAQLAQWLPARTFDTADTVLLTQDWAEATDVDESTEPSLRLGVRQRLIPTTVLPRSRGKTIRTQQPNRILSAVAALLTVAAMTMVGTLLIVDATEIPAPTSVMAQ